MTQAERRRQLRQQRRKERLRQVWRIVVFSSAGLALGYTLLRHGWVLSNADQIEVIGSRQVQPEQIAQVGNLRFPLPLMTLKPNRLAAELSAALPVDQVQVQRLMAPPRLRVQLVDRRAVARAERRGPKGLEQGFVDHLGNWMTMRQQASSQQVSAANALPLQVKGWQPQHRSALAAVLSRRQQLIAVRTIRFEPGGSLWFDTATLGSVRFGPIDDRLLQRLEVFEHLLKELPARLKGRPSQSIDLSDPDQPEIALPGPLKPGSGIQVNP